MVKSKYSEAETFELQEQTKLKNRMKSGKQIPLLLTDSRTIWDASQKANLN